MSTERQPYIPPKVATCGADFLSQLASVRHVRANPLKTWPRAMYEARFYRRPPMPILWVMDVDALHEIYVARAEEFPPSKIAHRMFRPLWRNGVATSEGEEWRWQRRAAAPAFSPKAVEAIVPAARHATAHLSKLWLSPTHTPDIEDDLGDLATRVVFETLMGDGLGVDEAKFRRDARAFSLSVNAVNLADVFQTPDWTRPLLGQTLHKPSDALRAHVAQALAHRQSGQAGSLLDMLATATDPETGQTITPERLQNNITGMLPAGRDTTANWLAWILYLIAHDLPTQERMVAEIDAVVGTAPFGAEHLEKLPFTSAVMMEALRLFPPAAQIAREAAHDTDLGGQKVRKGMFIIIPIYAIQRHRDYWDQPDAFLPERFLPGNFDPRTHRYSFMPFGAGERICLGMAFAKTEALAVLVTLLQRLRVSAPEHEPPMDFTFGGVLRAKGGIRLNIAPRD
ncbi:MAG: cytochrome P450 [Alphaproteobacteria bacterium]|nr:cytochrome P450 [Alphaproteobacteria bacterium]MDE2041849.1 cytochrome P450 [Alphaproteobacteria bacterium]